jgi:hypothetical protein
MRKFICLSFALAMVVYATTPPQKLVAAGPSTLKPSAPHELCVPFSTLCPHHILTRLRSATKTSDVADSSSLTNAIGTVFSFTIFSSPVPT